MLPPQTPQTPSPVRRYFDSTPFAGRPKDRAAGALAVDVGGGLSARLRGRPERLVHDRELGRRHGHDVRHGR